MSMSDGDRVVLGDTVRLRVIVVDDEPAARRYLRSVLEGDVGVEVVADCGNGRDALSEIARHAPDLLLLDIQMPELDGFAVLASLPAEAMPDVIFVTAFDEYAVRAFDVHALDYVLKPVARERLLQSVARAKRRARDRVERERGAERVAALLRELRGAGAVVASGARIAVKVGGRMLFLDCAAIDWIEAVDDYVRVHLARVTHLVRGTLGSFERRLGPEFLRVHRSALVNIDRIREVEPLPQGDYRITLADGTRLRSGRSYRPALAAFLQAFAVRGR